RFGGDGKVRGVDSHSGLELIAVATARINQLHHPNLHPAFGRAAQAHFVHEVPDQEYSTAAWFEKVVWFKRVGESVRIETLALITDQNANPRFVSGCSQEFDEDML